MVVWWRVTAGLVARTLSVWWTVLPQVLVLTMAGWFSHQLGLHATRSIQETHPWITVIVFSTGLVGMLATMVMSIRVAGTAAGVWEALPEPVARVGRDEPLITVVSISLLPFIGIYSLFGGIDESTNALAIIGAFNSETYAQSSAAWVLDPDTAQQRWILGAVIVGCSLVRRGLEAAHDRWNLTVVGVLGALVEGFSSVVLIFGGSQMLGDLWAWLSERTVAAWWEGLVAGVMGVLGSIHQVVPEVVSWTWMFITGTLWPLLTGGLLAPLLWLVAAGEVHGSHTLSLAELWERGARRVQLDPGASRRLGRWRRGLTVSEDSRAVVVEATGLFFGDLEDRILPFLQSARHVLRVGWVFLGSYVLVHAVLALVQPVVEDLVLLGFGGREFIWWSAADPLVALVGTMAGQPLVVCLLAVTLVATIHQPDATPVGEQGAGLGRFDSVGARDLRRTVPVVLVTVGSLVAASVLSRVDLAGDGDIIRVGAGQVGWFTAGQSIEVVDVQAGTVSGSHEQMTTTGVFLGVDVRFATRVNEMIALSCSLLDADGDRIAPINRPDTGLPEAGFQVTRRFLFERPAADLVGASLRCSSAIGFQNFQPVPIVDLGLDQARVDALVTDSPGRVVGYEREDEEVIR